LNIIGDSGQGKPGAQRIAMTHRTVQGQLHDEKRKRTLVIEFQHAYNVRMAQTWQDTSLIPQLFESRISAGSLHNLHRNVVAKLNMRTQKDLPGAAMSQRVGQPVRTDALPL